LRKREWEVTGTDETEKEEPPSKAICLNKTPLFHAAMMRKDFTAISPASLLSRDSSAALLLEEEIPVKDSDKTFIYYPADCYQHDTGDHQESVKRLDVLVGEDGILRGEKFKDLCWLSSCKGGEVDFKERVKLVDILRVHEINYWNHVKQRCTEQTLGKLNNKFDFDTILSAGTLDAVLSTVGACIEACDNVATGKNKNAFVVSRPPGHHAGSMGAVASSTFHSNPEMCSNGFCCKYPSMLTKLLTAIDHRSDFFFFPSCP
jgi:hypothetical protein